MTATVGLVGHGVKALVDMMALPAVLRRFELPLGRYADLTPRAGNARLFAARSWTVCQRDRRIDHIRLAPIQSKGLGSAQWKIGSAIRIRWPDTASI